MASPRRLDIVDLGDDPLDHDGAVVVIDVIRAFTSAAVAFTAGARRITCVASLEEAFAWRDRDPSVVLLGEEHGQRPDGFDLGNSPVEIAAAAAAGALAGASLVQRTSNGTRGLAATTATVVLAAAATSAAATTAHLDAHHPGLDVLFVCTGATEEDRACAEYMVALLRHGHGDRARLVTGIEAGARAHEEHWRQFHGEAGVRAFRADLVHCTAVDAHPVAMVGTRRSDGVVLAPHRAQ